jgi:hypothetical protein
MPRKTKQNKYYNYWHTTIDGQKVIRRLRVLVDPNTDPEYSMHTWTRGSGSITPERHQNLLNAMLLHRGVPKTTTHRSAMSRASLGRSKSPEHIESMRIAHIERIARVKALMQEQPELSYHQAVTVEAKIRRGKA